MTLENVINYKLFTVSNIVAIGAIVFFWGCVAYALRTSVNQQPATS